MADGYSRHRYENDKLDVLSRIDRALMDSHTTDLDEVRASARYVSAIAVATVPGDHVVLELVLQLPRSSRRKTIPRWVIDHPMFEAMCAEVFSETDLQDDPPFAALSRAVSIFHVVAQQCQADWAPTTGEVLADNRVRFASPPQGDNARPCSLTSWVRCAPLSMRRSSPASWHSCKVHASHGGGRSRGETAGARILRNRSLRRPSACAAPDVLSGAFRDDAFLA